MNDKYKLPINELSPAFSGHHLKTIEKISISTSILTASDQNLSFKQKVDGSQISGSAS